MIKNPKKLIDMGLNAAICGSFAIPAVGPAIAGVLGGGRFLFDAFFPFPNRANPMSLAPNKADLKNAMDELALKIDEILFTNDKTSQAVALLDENDKYRDRLDDIHNNKMPAYLGSAAAKVQDKNFRKDFESYFDTGAPGNTIDNLNHIANWVTVHLSHENQTLPLYTFAVGIFNMYCKLGMVWEVNEIINSYKSDLDAYKHDPAIKAWQAAMIKWKHADEKTRGPEPIAPRAKPQQPYLLDEKNMTAAEIKKAKAKQTEAFKTNSIFADKIKHRLPAYIKHAKTIHSKVQADFNTRAANLKPYAPKKPTGHETLAEQKKAMADGVKYAAIWKRDTAKFKLENIDQDTLTKLKQTIAKWEETLAQF